MFKIKKLLILSFSFALCLLWSFALTCYAQDKPAGAEKEYVISPNNILVIDVYQEPDLSVTVRVSQDGSITYPLLGNLRAVGLNVRELEKLITDLLSEDYIVNPQVSIFVKEYAKISVLGQVRTPGSYELKGGLTVIDAIALAGGFSDKADAENVKLVRTKNEVKQTIDINAKEIVDEGKKERDILLEPGDLIIVGEFSEASVFVSVLGQVRSPGRYNFKKGLTVIEAVALAGGLTNTAAANGTKVIRVQEDGKKKTIPVPVGSILQGREKSRDILLEPNDTIVVPESFF